MLTGQHRSLLDQALEQFDIKADFDLNLMEANQKLSRLTARALMALGEMLEEQKPDLVLAQGDTTTVMAAAMACFYASIPFGHVEAGLRTGDLTNPFPEEYNRTIAGITARLHFAPTAAAAASLIRSGVPFNWISLTGNTVIDALRMVESKLPAPPLSIPDGHQLILLTAHRRENFGAPLAGVFELLRNLLAERRNLHVLYPVHPNPNVGDMARKIFADSKRAHLIEPLGHQDFVAAMKAATVILTDSGGVQEEAPALGKPVLVLRAETERPEALSFGVARLVGTDPVTIRNSLEILLDDESERAQMSTGASPYGDGLASKRIVQAIADFGGIETSQPRLGPFDPTSA